MKLIMVHNAREAALDRITDRLQHRETKDRFIWRNGHQPRWLERLYMRMTALDDGRFNRLFLKKR